MRTFFLLICALAIASCSAHCSRNNRNYKAGQNQAQVQFRAAWRYANYDCDKLDKTYRQVLRASPSRPMCLKEGFDDKVQQLYKKEDKKCNKITCEDKGVKRADDMWMLNRKTIGKKCSQLDKVFEKTNAAAPTKPKCEVTAYNNRVEELYTREMDKCVDVCVGNGEDTGERIGRQFCSIAQLSLYAVNADGITVEICDAQEKQACLDEYENYVEDKCSSLLKGNQQFYNDLKATCDITFTSGTGPF
ncbi:hypothetical protein SARC_12701 [Sphaeroforma arctica JP610]|uniref:Uncharacterized protein n=1 Tax=Sphaeroforma arctica JP610 TaxID=667725 RepID=A0A0L0FFE2_9EUKA|nr:hypothetical protein SARC_12701 [Sphaeroforma arctica JP610]KNC74758.1 hypothetical protein SARC_12701 [Sphaeroforma arctica JP610]|eukprot:XP_014148660.1 hypothetical protein SARC_12701 [Sphaeroforma arctica JP610]